MLSSDLLNFTVNATSVDNDQPNGSSEMCGVWHGACVTGIVVFGVAILCTCAKIWVQTQMVSSRQQGAAPDVFSDSTPCEHAEAEAMPASAVAVPVIENNSTESPEEDVVAIEMSEAEAVVVVAVAEIVTATQAEAVEQVVAANELMSI